MRQINDGLQYPFIPIRQDFVQKHGKQNRYRKIEDQFVYVDDQRIPDQLPEISVLKEYVLKVFQADKFSAE